MQFYNRLTGKELSAKRFKFLSLRAWIPVAAAAGISTAICSMTMAADASWESLGNGVVGQRAEIDGVGGVKVAGYVRKPEGNGPFPLIILLHGATAKARPVTGTNEQDRLMKEAGEADHASDALGKAMSPPIQDMLAQGWAVYYVDYRPNPRYKIDPLEIEDTMRAYNKALTFPFVNPKLMAIIGGSHGGHITGRMASRANFCCAILCAPAGLDLIALSHLEEKGVKIGANHGLLTEMEHRSKATMAEIEKNPAAYNYSSLMTEVSQVKCPIFLISGVNDPNAPIDLMDSYLDALRKAGKDVEPPYHPANGPHGFYVGLPHHIPETDEATKLEIAYFKKEFARAAAAH